MGGVSFFPDGEGGKPWENESGSAQWDFWGAREQWLPSWQENDPALKIDWVRVTEV